MVALVIERCNKTLKECFGVNSFAEIPFFDTTLDEFINQKINSMNFTEIFRLDLNSSASDTGTVLEEVKKFISKTPEETVFITCSDVVFSDNDFFDFVRKINQKMLIVNAKNEMISFVLSSAELMDLLNENSGDLYSVCNSIKEKTTFDSNVEIVNNPLKYKALCGDVLSGKITYRLPEIAQGIYATSHIPNGDFVLIPPVYFDDNIQVEKGCVIGPGTIISSGVLVAENTHIRNSFLGENTYVSSGCHIEGSLLSNNVVLRRNSVIFDSSVLCHDVRVGEDAVIEKGGFIRSFSNVDEYRNNYVNYKIDDTTSTEGFYGYSPEKSALLGAALGQCFDMPRIAVASDGELNSTALKLAFLGGLITTGAACYDFGNAFFSSLHYFMKFCELDCAAFVSGNDTGTVISVFKKGEASLSKSDFYNIKSVFSSGNVERCSKADCKSIRQIHGMQRMYIQNLTNMFDKSLDFLPVFSCDNKRILSVSELAASKIGFKSGKHRVEFNINPWGTRASAQSEGIVYTYSKLLEIVSFFARKQSGFVPDDIYRYDAVILCFYILKILSDEKLTLNEVVGNLPQFYIAQRNIDNPCKLKILAADLSQKNKIDFRKDEIIYNDGLNMVKINEIKKGSLSIKAKSHSMEAATEIVENLTRLIYDRGSYNY